MVWYERQEGASMLKKARRLFRKGKYIKAAKKVDEILDEYEEEGVTEQEVLVLCGVWDPRDSEGEDVTRDNE